MPIKAYKYRIYPTKAQAKKFEHWLDICCELYNAALQERREAWQVARKSITRFDQFNELPKIKEVRGDLKQVFSDVLRDPIIRVDKALKFFFRRVQAGEKIGYPRYRPRSRYNSFTYCNIWGHKIDNGKLRISKIGHIKIKLHRPVEGKVKNLTITRSTTGKWYACFLAEVDLVSLEPSSGPVGIDCGLEKLATLSNGEFIENPRFLRKGEKSVNKAQRKLSATIVGSRERARRRMAAAHIYERISNRRRNLAHLISRQLVNKYSIIVFEKLNIKGMVKNHSLAKSISDAAWYQLITFTTYKAEWAGRSVALVDPRNTSKMCSGCREMVEKALSMRLHSCPSCGLVIDRDINAAKNILALGLQALGLNPKSPALNAGNDHSATSPKRSTISAKL